MTQVWQILLVALVWMQSHPAECVLLAGAACSAFQKQLDRVPLVGKMGRVMAALGVNVGALRAELLPKVPVVVDAAEKAVEAKVAGK